MRVTALILCSSIYYRHVMTCALGLKGSKKVIREQQPRLFENDNYLHKWRHLGIPSFGIELDEVSIFREVVNLQLPSDAPSIVMEEVADALYWDRGLESFSLSPRLGQPRIDLFKNLYEIAFKTSDLVFDELRALLTLKNGEHVAEFEFGQASTYPLIADFVRAISSDPACNIEQIKRVLIAHYEDISKALTQGRSYDIIAFTLQRRACAWILDYPLLIKENVELSRLLCNMHDQYSNHNLPAFRQRFLDIADQIKDFFVPLSRLSEQAAVEKLLLMINFPQYATYIYEHTSAEVLKFIFGASLTGWRAEMANSLKWERILPTECLRFISLESQNNYYDGYWINSKFDDLIYGLGCAEPRASFNEESPEIFAKSLREYKRRVVMEERLGTVYSIFQEKFGLAGPINPLSEEVDNNFEKQIIMKLNRVDDTWEFWLGQKYLQSVNVLASRLAFYPMYNMHNYFDDSFRDDNSNFANILQDMHSSIAKICSLPENLTLSLRIKERDSSSFYILFRMVLYNLIEHCVPEVCIPNILNYLEDGGDEDFVTSKLLLALLRRVAQRHFSGAKQIYFDCFSKELKNGLLNLLKR